KYLFDLFVIASIYFALIKLDQALATIHPNAIAVAPALSFALAAILLRGVRVWPAIFVAALAANLPSHGSDLSVSDASPIVSIAMVSTVAAVIGGYLIRLWSDGGKTFESPARTAKFVTVSLGVSAIVGATFAVADVCLIGSGCSDFLSVWLTRWLRD